MAKHHASCQCGALVVESDVDPDVTVACNCRACQRRTGAPFGAALYFRSEGLSITGASRTYARKADSGRGFVSHFCPDCGTNVYWTLDMRPDHTGVAYGCCETPVPEPVRVVWTEEKHAWVQFPDAWPTFPRGVPERS